MKEGSAGGTGIGAVVDLVGNAASYKLADACLRRGGKHVVVGLFGGSVEVPLIWLPLKARTVEGSFTGSFEEAKEMIATLRRGEHTVLPHHFRPIT